MTFSELPDLAVRTLGGAVVAANDDLFAEKENLVSAAEPTHSPATFGPKGQLYDGWETRRRRTAGHDWAMVRLGVPGIVRGVVVDTAFFRGNYPPECSVEAVAFDGYPPPAELERASWTTLVERSGIAGDTRNSFPVHTTGLSTHVRLSIYPDGGVARLRVHGEPVPDPRPFRDIPLDLAALVNGGRVLEASNRFFGTPQNLIMPGLARVMGDGWETARRRDAGNDWVLLQLAGRGRVRVVDLDTSHFVGNAPGSAALRGADADSADLDDPAAWFELLPETELQPDTPHRFTVAWSQPVTHLRLDVFPDGGMARLRCFGVLTDDAYDQMLRRWRGSRPTV